MSRPLASRLVLSGILVNRTALHIGSGSTSALTDMPVARDGAGRLHIPGTSLAGPIRHLCQRRFGQEAIEELFGYTGPHGTEGKAGRILIDDAPTESSAVELRDHVVIAAETGTAKPGFKFDREIVPPETKFRLRIEVEIPPADEEGDDRRENFMTMLATIRHALKVGEVCLGGSSTRGLGRVQMTEDDVTEERFDKKQATLDTLKARFGLTKPTKASLPECRYRSEHLTITIGWKPIEPLMVRAGIEGEGVDALPLVTSINGQLHAVLGGSSIKGTLRSHARKIVNTLGVESTIVDCLLGAPKATPKGGKDKHKGPKLGKSALSVADIHARRSLSPTEWQKLVDTKDVVLVASELRNTKWNGSGISHHVAIDRWTGGAAENLLYTRLEPGDLEWPDIVMEIDFHFLQEHDEAAIALLVLLLQDMVHGQIRLGGQVNRGMGAIEINKLEMDAIGNGTATVLKGLTLADGALQLPDDALKLLQKAWSKALGATADQGGDQSS